MTDAEAIKSILNEIDLEIWRLLGKKRRPTFRNLYKELITLKEEIETLNE